MYGRLGDHYTWIEIANMMADRIEKNKFVDDFNRPDFIKWFMVREKVGMCFDWHMIARCYCICKQQDQKMDHFLLCIGPEGTGKSTFMIQVLSWISPGFVVKDICFTQKQYLSRLSEEYDKKENNTQDKEKMAVLLDEGGIDLYSKDALKKSNKRLGKTFLIQRVLGLSAGICVPYLFAIDKIVREHRVNTIILVKRKGQYKCITGIGIKRFMLTADSNRLQPLATISVPYGYFWDGVFNKRFPGTMSQDSYEQYKYENVGKFIKDQIKDIEGEELKEVLNKK